MQVKPSTKSIFQPSVKRKDESSEGISSPKDTLTTAKKSPNTQLMGEYDFIPNGSDEENINKLPKVVVNQMISSSSNDPYKQNHLILSLKKRKQEHSKILLKNLKENQYFKQFIRNFEDDEELDPFVYVCQNIKLQKYEAGDVILKQGEPSDGRVYLVYKGDLLVIVKSAAFLAEGAHEQPKNQINITNLLKGKLELPENEEPTLALDSTRSKKGGAGGGAGGNLSRRSGGSPKQRGSISNIQQRFSKMARKRPSVQNPLMLGQVLGMKGVSKFKQSLQKNSINNSNVNSPTINNDRSNSVVTNSHSSSNLNSPLLQRNSVSAVPQINLQNQPIPSQISSPLRKKSTFGGMSSNVPNTNTSLNSINEIQKEGQANPTTFQNLDEEITSQEQSSLRSINPSSRNEVDATPSNKSIMSPQLALNMSKVFSKMQNKGGIKNTPRTQAIKIGSTQTEYGLVKDYIRTNGYFGDKAAKKQKRSATLVAKTDVELLIISEEHADYIKNKFDHTKNQFIRFINNSFNIPHFNQDQQALLATDTLLYLLQVEDYERNNKIITQGDEANSIFLINNGECEIVKTFIFDQSQNLNPNLSGLKQLYGLTKTQKEDIPVCSLSNGSFFGLDSLFIKDGYRYSVRVTSDKAKVLRFDTSKIEIRCSKSLIGDLQKIFATSEKNNLEMLKLKLERKKIVVKEEMILQIHPILSVQKRPNSDVYLQNLLHIDKERRKKQRTKTVVDYSTLQEEQQQQSKEKSQATAPKKKNHRHTNSMPEVQATESMLELPDPSTRAPMQKPKVPSPTKRQQQLKERVADIERIQSRPGSIMAGTLSNNNSQPNSPRKSNNSPPLQHPQQLSSNKISPIPLKKMKSNESTVYNFNQDELKQQQQQQSQHPIYISQTYSKPIQMKKSISVVNNQNNNVIPARRESGMYEQLHSPKLQLSIKDNNGLQLLSSHAKQSSVTNKMRNLLLHSQTLESSIAKPFVGSHTSIDGSQSQSKIMQLRLRNNNNNESQQLSQLKELSNLVGNSTLNTQGGVIVTAESQNEIQDKSSKVNNNIEDDVKKLNHNNNKKRKIKDLPHQTKSVYYHRVSSQKPVEEDSFTRGQFKKAKNIDDFFNNFVQKVKGKYEFVDEIYKDNNLEFINDVKNFKLNFEQQDKILEKRYHKLKMEMNGIYRVQNLSAKEKGIPKSILTQNNYADLAEFGARKFQDTMKKMDLQSSPTNSVSNIHVQKQAQNYHYTNKSDLGSTPGYKTAKSRRSHPRLSVSQLPDSGAISLKLQTPKASVSGFAFKKMPSTTVNQQQQTTSQNDISMQSLLSPQSVISPFVISKPQRVADSAKKNNIYIKNRADSSVSLNPIYVKNSRTTQSRTATGDYRSKYASLPCSPKTNKYILDLSDSQIENATPLENVGEVDTVELGEQ